MNEPSRSWVPWLVLAAFLTPFLLAAALRFGGWQPANTRNFGELVQPPIDLAETGILLEADARWTWRNEHHQWSLLLRAPADCVAVCLQTIEQVVRVRTALGEHAPRLHLFLVDLALPGATMQSLRPLQTGSLTGAIPQRLSVSDVASPEVFLVDPHGYLVMHYRAGFDPTGLRKDLTRLIR